MHDLPSFLRAFTYMLEDPAFTSNLQPRWRRAVAIHRAATRKAAEDALAANYPVLRSLLGEEAFAACAAAYRTAYPPREARLCFYGERLEHFLPAYLPFHDRPWLAGMARLERLCLEALFAPDPVPATPLAKSGDGGAEPRLTLHPAVRMLSHDAPLASLWLAHQEAARGPIAWRPETALVVRSQGQVAVLTADCGMEAFLLACLRGETAAEAEEAAEWQGADPAKVRAALTRAGAFT
jgi:hypothetical protein